MTERKQETIVGLVYIVCGLGLVLISQTWTIWGLGVFYIVFGFWRIDRATPDHVNDKETQ